MKTTTNKRVQFYLTYSDKRASKHLKIKRMQQLEQDLEKRGEYIDELFQRKTIRVLDEIAYLTTMCGVIKIGADRLANNADVSVRTVYNAVKTIKTNAVGFYVGYLKNSHKYVFVDLKHKDAKAMLADLFKLSEREIAELFAVHFAVHENVAKPVVSTVETNISDSNNKTNKLKDFKDIKTSTKDSKTSPSNNNLYSRLKALFNARKGSLSNFKTFIGVIYGRMKKLKSDANMSLSHAQIEAIMYNSLDALLNMSNVKNELAMLNAIIKNKINDVLAPAATNTKARVELVPDWFESRNDDTKAPESKNSAAAVDFEVERAKFLAKLGY